MADPDAGVLIQILNRDTEVNTNSIQVRLDGTNITGASLITADTTEGPGATITYRPGVWRTNTVHTLSLSFADNAGTPRVQSNQWSFVVRDLLTLPTSFAHSGAGLERGFKVQIHKARNDAGLPNSSGRAEQQLAGQLVDPNTGQQTRHENH